MKINLKPATLKDREFIKKMLYEAVFWKDKPGKPALEEGIKLPGVYEAIDGFGKGSDIGVIAYHNNLKVGAAWIRKYTKDKHIRGFIDEETLVLVIAVDNAYRNKGIAYEMLTDLLNDLRKTKYKRISLAVTKDNIALGLYQKCGFKTYQDIGDSLIMEYKLNSGILEDIKNELESLKDYKTSDVRRVAKSYKKKVSKLPMEAVYQLCESLLKSKVWKETITGYQIIFDQKSRYDKNTFDVFENWMKKYILDWWDCDDFMTHAFKEVLIQYPHYIDRIYSWTTHQKFAVRRSAPVVLIRLAEKKLISSKIIFDICDRLISDDHHLVQKGYGWLLKVSVKNYHDEVIKYLEKHVDMMPRTAFRYAIEKCNKEEKKYLMSL